MPALQQHQTLLLPQAFLSNLHNRVKNDSRVSLVDNSLAKTQVRGAHKRAKVVNYAEFDNELFDDLLAGSGAAGGDTVSGGVNADVEGHDSGADSDENEFLVEDNTTEQDEDKGGNSSNNNLPKVKKILPDLDEQEDLLNVLKYPRIRETFQQSKIAVPYRLNLFKHLDNTVPLTTPIVSYLPELDEENIDSPKDEVKETSTAPLPPPTPQQTAGTTLEPIIIPVMIDIDNNGTRITDQFTWNINDNTITPEEFANIYCQDLDFPSNSNVNQQVVSAITDCIQEYETVAAIKFQQDLQVLVNLTCHLQDVFLEDNFQWNLNNNDMTPEMFAEILVTDLGLKREFLPLITHSLHLTLLKIKKEYMEGNLSHISANMNGTNLANEAAFGYLTGVRLNLEDLGENWAPKIELLTQEEIQRKEIEKERKLRRLKRENDRLGRRGRRRLEELELTMKL